MFTSRCFMCSKITTSKLLKPLSSRNMLNFPAFRSYSSPKNDRSFKSKSTLYYIAGVGVLAVGLSYAAVPLYRLFCQAYSYGGTTGVSEVVGTLKKLEDRPLKIRFNADIGSSMRWNFKPQQSEITVFSHRVAVPVTQTRWRGLPPKDVAKATIEEIVPGETALAFYTARNPTDRPVTGISTYNVVPFEAGQYFNKIQCFCFEEQMLNPHEEVDMPVFFYIDPEFAEDPKMELVKEIILSYTFFEAKEGLKLPIPSYVKPHAAALA